MKLVFYLLALLTFISCGQTEKRKEKYKVDLKAQELNNRGVKLALTLNEDSILKAISMLDQATKIQPDYYLAHWNKFIYQNQLGLTKDALTTLKDLEKLTPENPDWKVELGIFMEVNGDSLKAREKYVEADRLYKSILDTLTSKTEPYQMILTNRAVNLKLLGYENEGDKILKEISSKQADTTLKELFECFVTLTRKELIENFKQRNGKYPNL